VKYEIENKESEDETKKKQMNTKTTTISIRSKTLSLPEMNIFVEDITKSFLEDLERQTTKNQYFFEFEKIDEDGYCVFSEKIFNTNRTFDSIFFEQKDELLEKYMFFMNNKDWYDRIGIPYHFGMLLYGIPGCGKTSIIKALAKLWEKGKEYKKDHIISVPLSRVKHGKDLTKIFHTDKLNRHKIPISNRIYLFEDLDCMMNPELINRSTKEIDDKDMSIISTDGESLPDSDITNNALMKFIKAESNKINGLSIQPTYKLNDDPVSLSHFLNLIDGLLEMPGRRIIFTTNHRDKLDPALIRKGRIDIELKLSYATPKMINKMYQWFYQTDSLSDTVISNLPNNKFTPAEINNIFYLNNKHPKNAIDKILEM